MFDYVKINWKNCWRLAFILLFLAGFFEMIMDMEQTARVLFCIGGPLFIILFVIRIDDVREFMDRYDE
jgi:hypothetical protein